MTYETLYRDALRDMVKASGMTHHAASEGATSHAIEDRVNVALEALCDEIRLQGYDVHKLLDEAHAEIVRDGHMA